MRMRFADAPRARDQIDGEISHAVQSEGAGGAIHAWQAQRFARSQRSSRERGRVEFAAEAHVGEDAARIAPGIERAQLCRDCGTCFPSLLGWQRVAGREDFFTQGRFCLRQAGYFCSHVFT